MPTWKYNLLTFFNRQFKNIYIIINKKMLYFLQMCYCNTYRSPNHISVIRLIYHRHKQSVTKYSIV